MEAHRAMRDGLVLALALALAVASSFGCQVTTTNRAAPAPQPSYGANATGPAVQGAAVSPGSAPGPAGSPGVGARTTRFGRLGTPGGAISRSEMHRPGSARQHAGLFLFLPGSNVQQLVNYQVTDDGMAVYEGDILLGPASGVLLRYGAPRVRPNVKGAVTLADTSNLWPNGEIPFVIDSSVPPTQVQAIQRGIQMVNQTSLRVRPRAAADRDFIVFRDPGEGSGCSSFIGRAGGPQDVIVDDCVPGSVAHEILHAAGFFHEQSRGDRDNFITVVFDEIDPEFRSDFEKRDGRGQDIGPYDYGSVMHYPSTAFSRTGRPTIIPKTPGVSIGQRDGLSPLDRDAVTALYGAPSTSSQQPAPAPPPAAPPSAPSIPPSAPPPPAPPPATVPAPAPVAGGSVAGSYTSTRGNVACAQNGNSVSCQYPGGLLFCTVNAADLACAWSGGGQGLAHFQRQASGVLAGSFGDFLSTTSRGAWDLVPAGSPSDPRAAGPNLASPSAPAVPPTGAPPPPSPSAPVSLSGTYASTRGPMNCVDNGAFLSCSFQEAGAIGRLDCTKDASGSSLGCTWLTLPPRPASGRATFTRTNPGARGFTGAWGFLTQATGGGTWEARPQ